MTRHLDQVRGPSNTGTIWVAVIDTEHAAQDVRFVFTAVSSTKYVSRCVVLLFTMFSGWLVEFVINVVCMEKANGASTEGEGGAAAISKGDERKSRLGDWSSYVVVSLIHIRANTNNSSFSPPPHHHRHRTVWDPKSKNIFCIRERQRENDE